MRVAAVQYKAPKGDKSAALREIESLVRLAPPTDLVVLPELAATGYLFDDRAHVTTIAENPDGELFQLLSKLAAERRCWMVCGFVERAADRLFNSALVVQPDGTLAFTYRKTLLFDADVPWASPGDSGYRVFTTDAGTFTVGICMDLNDDQFTDWCRESNPHAIAFPTNWIEEGEPTWPYWAWRLEGYPGALVAANTWGPEREVTFSGKSAVLQRLVIRAAAPAEGNRVIAAKVLTDRVSI